MSKKGFAGFDPEGLERAAEAVRELSQSPHAQSVIQLQIRQQEAKSEEAKALQKERELKKITHDHEERRKTLQKNLEINKETADYNDKLERKRHTDKLKLQDEFQEQQRKKQEESIKREEKLKRETMEHQLKIEEKRLLIKGKVDAEMYRKNHDLHKQELLMREAERRETYKQIFQLNFNQLSLGFEYLMNNPSFMYKFFLYTASITTAFYFSRHSIQLGKNILFLRIETNLQKKLYIFLGSRYLESVIGKPSLIRETSKLSYKQFYKFPLKFYKQVTQNEQILKKNIFQNIILAPELKDNLQIISHALINKKKHQAPLRNLLFYGPPGTGKTLFAQQLAHSSGLDFAIMTGSDIAPLGSQGVHELNKVFDWANKSSNGILLFIDEADAFFRKRENWNSIEKSYGRSRYKLT
ncbi:P-loop containing nucleoside triphosphate hydrolase [Pseudocohnilembus persalinus]|uniref:p-loop containing nucleoside triphosphate hydrolase n=1 Tax=Pseudocohnilembus persalinus TaxID=266149 RepID=A0A0V0QN79_PSEPJ|nr:P-loop containing nucleoside triphosphate hydrolase [Pseudocohnilembus persalinus]|eukprot:KRX03739.1 P-loop containing nucleoside triphosphate hydrolase [Pseudocohnilembus persalinus]